MANSPFHPYEEEKNTQLAAATTAAQADATSALSKIGTHKVIAAGIHTSTNATDNDITVAGAVATDIVVATMHTVGASPVTLKNALAATGKITLTFSGAPSTDHKVNYIVLRAV